MRLQELVDVSNEVAAVRGRLEKTARLAQLLKRLQPDEVCTAVAYLIGSLPQGRIGLGWSAIAGARSISAARAPSLELRDVDEMFGRISHLTGAGSTKARTKLLGDLFQRSTPDEQGFLARLLAGELRQGAVEGVLAEAIAKAADTTSDTIRHAAMMCGDLSEVARIALVEGPAGLSKFSIELFRPVEPMLASTAENVEEALDSLGEAAFELKLDGARIQVHKSSDEVRVYSRALRDVTAAVPEVVEAVRAMPANELVLDGEVLALRPSGIPVTFQETMRRFGRRLEVDSLKTELPLTPYFFDCLLIDGRPLTDEPQRARFEIVTKVADRYAVPRRVTAEKSHAQEFFDRAISTGHEGLMAKALDAPYVAGSRGRAWLKIKHVRTLDLVVLAAEWGSGRRRGWLSNLHLGARGSAMDQFVMLGKTFKGMTAEILEWQTAALLERETRRDGHIVFVRPELVVEIAFNDIQESPQYPGGLALRFARVKGYRPDKAAADADTLDTIQRVYQTMTGRTPPPPRY
jgi:ATP-dependent DNA ligase I